MEEEFIEVDNGPEPEWMPPEEPPVPKDPRDLTNDPIRHVYLFAKGHYARSYDSNLGTVEPMIADVIRIIERAYGLETCKVDDVFKIILPHVWDSMGGPADFQEMFLFLRTQVINITEQPELTVIGVDEALCKMCLMIMAIRVTNGVLDLGFPDAKILTPKSTSPKNYRKGAK